MPEFFWKWRKEIIVSLLILLSLGVLASQRNPDVLSQTLRQGVTLLIVPLQKLSARVVGRARDSLRDMASLGRLRAENQALRRELEQLKLNNAWLARPVGENETLRRELGYRKETHWKFLPAEVVGRDPASWLGRAIVNRGSADGVKTGAGAITPDGIVGRVADVQVYSCTVMLLPDIQSSVAAVAERSKVPGSIKGAGSRWLSMAHVSGEDDVKAGDLIVTSKISSIFPAGLPVGTVFSVSQQDNGLTLAIRVKPWVNFQTLDRMLILLPGD